MVDDVSDAYDIQITVLPCQFNIPSMSAVFSLYEGFFKLGDVQCTVSLIQIMLILYHFTSPYDESERSLYHLVDRNMNSAI